MRFSNKSILYFLLIFCGRKGNKKMVFIKRQNRLIVGGALVDPKIISLLKMLEFIILSKIHLQMNYGFRVNERNILLEYFNKIFDGSN
jgi:hypothetical protein